MMVALSLFSQENEQLFSRNLESGLYDQLVNSIDFQQYVHDNQLNYQGPNADTCLSIKNIFFTELSKNEVTLHWVKGDSSTLTYIARYKRLIDQNYTYKIISDTTAMMANLAECTNYVFGVSSVCIQDTSGFKQVNFKTDCAGRINYESISATDLTPNPVFERLTFSTSSLKYKDFNILIYNSLGYLSYKQFISNNNEDNIIIPTDQLVPGVYIIRCFNQENSSSGTFIKM